MKNAIFNMKNRITRDNRGLSLVELLVAITIGAIVSGSIASLLIFSLRMYGKQTVDVEMQQEIQTTSNFIIDAIMESDSFIVSKSGSGDDERTDVAVLGRFEYKKNPTDDTDSSLYLFFTGYVFCPDSNVSSTGHAGKLYMKKYTDKKLTPACVNTGEIVPDNVIDKLSSGVEVENNLLATNVQIFNLAPTSDSIHEGAERTYSNPFSVKLKIQFAKNGGTSDVVKKLEDTIAIRNTLKPIVTEGLTEMTPVCINKADSADWKQYYQQKLTSKNDELKITTETVQMEKALGYIQTPGNEEAGGSRTFKILEIVPDYRCDYMQYIIGGTNGELLNDCRHYGDGSVDSSFSPLTSDEAIEVFSTNDGSKKKSIYPNMNGVDIYGIITPYENSKYGEYINNEVFKLFVLKDYIEPYAEGHKLDASCGIWNQSTGDYCEVNKKAIERWHENGNRVDLYVCTPSDLNEHTDLIEDANLIIFGDAKDGGFKWALDVYSVARDENNAPENFYFGTTGGDFSWETTKLIYKQVLAKNTCIACPLEMRSSSNVTQYNIYSVTKICLLYHMLYEYHLKNISIEDVRTETLNGHAYDDNSSGENIISNITCQGSGRELFRDVDTLEDVKNILERYEKYASWNDDRNTLRLDDYRENDEGDEYDSLYGGTTVYLNQMRYVSESNILSFYKNGVKGMLMLQTLGQSVSQGLAEAEPKETFGEVTIVGAAYDDTGRHVPGEYYPWGKFGEDSSGHTIVDSGTYYRFDVEKLSNPVEVMDGTEPVKIDKVIYFNEFELKQAEKNKVKNGLGEEHNLRVFCVVNSTADLDTEINLKVNGVVVPSPLHNDMKEELVSKYKTIEGTKIAGKDVHRTLECRADQDIPDGTGVNVYDKFLKVTAEMDINGKKATGTDYALIVVRDLFDLD